MAVLEGQIIYSERVVISHIFSESVTLASFQFVVLLTREMKVNSSPFAPESAASYSSGVAKWAGSRKRTYLRTTSLDLKPVNCSVAPQRPPSGLKTAHENGVSGNCSRTCWKARLYGS
jgi:hypothetical protein